MKSLLVKLGKIRLLWKRSGFWGGLKTLFSYLKIFLRAFLVRSGDVLFVSSGVGDSAHYRAYNPAEELRLHGFKAATTISDNPFLPRLADKFKVFIIHRAVFNNYIKKLIEKAKQQGKEIIFDTDDLVYDPQYLVHMDYFQKMSKVEQELYKKGIGAEIINDQYVKTCTTTTSYLAKKLEKKDKRVIIVPNRFSQEELSWVNEIIKKKKPKDEWIRIAYFSGTLSHNRDFATIEKVLLEVAGKFPRVKFVFVGPLDIPNNFQSLGNQIEVKPRVPRKEMYELIYKMDIVLAPLELDNPFCEAKSAIKFTEAGALEVPTVAVRNQTFSETIEDGADGFLADNTKEWVDKLSILVEDEELRKKMGQKARKKVLADYTNLNSNNQEYYDYLRKKIQKVSWKRNP